MATHSSLLFWEIPWTEETGRLQPIGSQGVRQCLLNNSKPESSWACVRVTGDGDTLSPFVSLLAFPLQLKTSPVPPRGGGPFPDSALGPLATSAGAACSWLPRKDRCLRDLPDLPHPARPPSRSSFWIPEFSSQCCKDGTHGLSPQKVSSRKPLEGSFPPESWPASPCSSPPTQSGCSKTSSGGDFW